MLTFAPSDQQMKTVSVALVMCLNVGVDPPDVVKIQPCARMECWIDPSSVSQQKALELIGTNLQKQYERWQPRARYKQSLDPTVEDVKKLCTSLRRNAKDERVLFHYNGHGVPRPTNNGEIWVFNRVSDEKQRLNFNVIKPPFPELHTVHPVVHLRSADMDGRALDLRLRLQQCGYHCECLQQLCRE